MNDKPVIPLEDMALDALEHAVNTSITRNENDEWVTVGGDFTLSKLLDFWSGYDPAKSVLISDPDEPGPPIYEYPHPTIHEHDLIRALVGEIRRLRALDFEVGKR